MPDESWREVPCRPWDGRRMHGYGYLPGKRGMAVHRFTWAQANGPIPPGMCVCHHCDNPPCYEITHLFLGTVSDNVADSIAKGRHINPHRRQDGVNNPRAKLSLAQVAAIRTAIKRNQTGRYEGIRATARQYGVTPGTIWALVQGRTWQGDAR